MNQTLLIEKLSPKKPNSLILPSRIKNLLFPDGEKTVLKGNFIFAGTGGIGKSSTAKLLALYTSGQREEDGSLSNIPFGNQPGILHIDATTWGNIEVIREIMEPFCISSVFSTAATPYKTIILEEIDKATPKFLDGLKAFSERFYDSVRFIATTNTTHSLEKSPISSRFPIINFNAINDKEKLEVSLEISKIVKAVCVKLDISHTPDQIQSLVATKYPDIRQIFNILDIIFNSSKDLSLWTGIKVGSSDKSDIETLHEFVISSEPPQGQYVGLFQTFGESPENFIHLLCVDYMKYLISGTNNPHYMNACVKLLDKVQWYDANKHLISDPFIHAFSLYSQIKYEINKI